MDQPGRRSALIDDVGFLLSRASGLVARASNSALAAHGLRVRPYSVLLLSCDAEEGLSQRELADALGLDPSQVVLLVDELTAAGLVERQVSRTDRRTKLVSATEAGRAVREAASRDVDGALAAQLGDLSADERGQLQGLLARLVLGPRTRGLTCDPNRGAGASPM